MPHIALYPALGRDMIDNELFLTGIHTCERNRERNIAIQIPENPFFNHQNTERK
jgi:hypothetical protein